MEREGAAAEPGAEDNLVDEDSEEEQAAAAAVAAEVGSPIKRVQQLSLE